MFAKIKDSNKINYLVRNAKKIHSKDFVLFFDCKNIMKTEIVIIVPKKKFKKAVDRNYIKRQITAILIQSKILDTLTGNYSLIIMVKETYNTNNFLTNKKNILSLFQKLGG
ncbi:MAG: ribonuclease P protein component [Ureaplasma sp.]|nr:ribonuclease P protein component [Ureaplasma sp.]